MSAMTDYLEGEIIKHIFRTGSFTKPSVLAIGLFTVAPTDAGGGTEVTGGSYARVQRDPLDANWEAPAGGNGRTRNVADMVFPAPTANWGQVVAWAIFDATSGGNMLFHHTLATPKTVNNGDPAPKFNAQAMEVTFD